jgi:hypothetical protein
MIRAAGDYGTTGSEPEKGDAAKVSSPAMGIRTSDWIQRPIRVHKP